MSDLPELPPHEVAAVLGGAYLIGLLWWPYGMLLGAAVGALAVFLGRRETASQQKP